VLMAVALVPPRIAAAGRVQQHDGDEQEDCSAGVGAGVAADKVGFGYAVDDGCDMVVAEDIDKDMIEGAQPDDVLYDCA